MQRKMFRVACILLATGSLNAASASQPRILKTIPEAGATDVDPSLREIRVTFDQDMSQESFSWCGGGDTFPEILGRPGWDGPRVAVMKVKLKPGHQYHLSINCPSAQGFRSKSGEAAQIYPLSFKTRGGSETSVSKATPADHKESARMLFDAIQNHYSYRDLRVLDWSAQYGRFREKLESAPSSLAFARTAAEMMAPAKDLHLWFDVNGQHIGTTSRRIPPNGNPRLLQQIVPNFTRASDAVMTGRFDDGIGYILIASWANDKREALEAAYASLGEFSDVKKLIIDARFNSGGNEDLAGQFAGCFVDKESVYAKHVTIDGKGGFHSPSSRTLRPNRARPQWRGQIVVLTGPYAMSSNEAFLLMMKQVPGCKLIGENSYGASGNPRPYKLPNGVTAFLPSWKAMLPTEEVFEGIGIAPDIEVKASPEEFEDKDPVIDAALKFLRS